MDFRPSSPLTHPFHFVLRRIYTVRLAVATNSTLYVVAWERIRKKGPIDFPPLFPFLLVQFPHFFWGNGYKEAYFRQRVEGEKRRKRKEGKALFILAFTFFYPRGYFMAQREKEKSRPTGLSVGLSLGSLPQHWDRPCSAECTGPRTSIYQDQLIILLFLVRFIAYVLDC